MEKIQHTISSERVEEDPSLQERDSLGPEQEAPRVPFLDGIRGVAILLVLIHHANKTGQISLLDTWFMNFTQSCWVGVDLFFVLSGFLITGILLDTKTSGHFFKSFYARRIVRIFPLYYLTLFLYFYVYQPFFAAGDMDLRALKDDQLWYWAYLSNVHTSMHGTWPRAGHMIHLWSVSIEEQFYMLWPTVVFFASRKRLKFICLCCLVGSPLLRALLMASYAGPIPTYVSSATRLDGLVLGALIAIMIRRPDEIMRLTRNLRAAGAASVAIVIGFFVMEGGLNMTRVFDYKGSLNAYNFLMMTVAILAVAFIFAWLLVEALIASPNSLFVRLLSGRVLRVFGKYSYCIYMWHMPILLILLSQGLTPGKFPVIFGSQILGQTILYTVFIGLSLIAAMISWNLFEKQFLKLKRYFPYGTVVHPGQSAGATQRAIVDPEQVVLASVGKS